MCEYHLNVGDMFQTEHGLGLIVKKKNSNFHYATVFRVDGGDLSIGTSKIPTMSFYESVKTGAVQAVYMTDRKYRRKRK